MVVALVGEGFHQGDGGVFVHHCLTNLLAVAHIDNSTIVRSVGQLQTADNGAFHLAIFSRLIGQHDSVVALLTLGNIQGSAFCNLQAACCVIREIYCIILVRICCTRIGHIHHATILNLQLTICIIDTDTAVASVTDVHSCAILHNDGTGAEAVGGTPIDRHLRPSSDGPSTTVGEVAADVRCRNLRVVENELSGLCASGSPRSRNRSIRNTAHVNLSIIQRQCCTVPHINTVVFVASNLQLYSIQCEGALVTYGKGMDARIGCRDGACPGDGHRLANGVVGVVQGGVLQQGDGAAVSCNSVQSIRQRATAGLAILRCPSGNVVLTQSDRRKGRQVLSSPLQSFVAIIVGSTHILHAVVDAVDLGVVTGTGGGGHGNGDPNIRGLSKEFLFAFLDGDLPSGGGTLVVGRHNGDDHRLAYIFQLAQGVLIQGHSAHVGFHSEGFGVGRNQGLRRIRVYGEFHGAGGSSLSALLGQVDGDVCAGFIGSFTVRLTRILNGGVFASINAFQGGGSLATIRGGLHFQCTAVLGADNILASIILSGGIAGGNVISIRLTGEGSAGNSGTYFANTIFLSITLSRRSNPNIRQA